MKLHPHQEEFINRNPHKHLIAFDTGTGKTITAISLAIKNMTATGKKLTYVVTPKKVKSKWVDNINTFVPELNELLKPETPSEIENFVVMTKEEFKKNVLFMDAPEAIIVDEAHYFAGLKSQLSRMLQRYIRINKLEYIWLLTATPYMSTPWNIYVLSRCLGNDVNYNFWLKTFFKPKYLGFKVVHVIDDTKHRLLQDYIRTIGTVVSMESVVESIPEQTDEFIYVSLTEEQKNAILKINGDSPLTGFTHRHQIENGVINGNEYEKDQEFPEYKLTFIRDALRENKKVAIYVRYTLQLKKYKRELTALGYNVLTLSGDTKDAGEIIKEANDLENVVIIIQSQCSEGYELPGFDLCIFASLSFSYKDYKQARGRFLRINKMKENKFLHLIVSGKKSTDMAIWNAIKNKQDFNIELYLNSN